jgi:hypothetical protein
MIHVKTDISGRTPIVELGAPPLEFSTDATIYKQPYSKYDIEVYSKDFIGALIKNVQILPSSEAIQEVFLTPTIYQSQDMVGNVEVTVIGEHTLWGNYPDKIMEDEVKPLPESSGFVVLDKPVIPQFIIVHDGVPSNLNARSFWVPFKNYIKNVASSEIYSTWSIAALEANIHAIISFTLNRVYTEWYRSRGRNFTITSSTAFDQAFIYGRNIYSQISVVVDRIFSSYITRPNITQPILAQYCDGRSSTCPGGMSQWGSQELGLQGTSTINVLRNFYGENVYLDTAPKVAGAPSSFPGFNLQVGSRGDEVRRIQRQLNAISNNFPAIGRLSVDGIFGNLTKSSVQTFQQVFNLPANGIVDFPTWYRIAEIFVAVTRMAT